MAKDTRGAAVNSVPAECSGRRWVSIAWTIALTFTSLDIFEICGHTPVASSQKELIMPVTFHIPGALREFTGGRGKVEIESSPRTLGAAFSALWILYPGVRDRITTEQGQVREHINVFIRDENVRYTGGLASPVDDGDEISIVPAISGGSISLCAI